MRYQSLFMVEDVDVKNRTITLLTPDGRTFPLKVGDEVQNLAQVDKGDTLELEYLQSVEFEVRKPTEEEVALSGLGVGVAGRAPLGTKPGGLVAGQQIGVVTIPLILNVREASDESSRTQSSDFRAFTNGCRHKRTASDAGRSPLWIRFFTRSQKGKNPLSANSYICLSHSRRYR